MEAANQTGYKKEIRDARETDAMGAVYHSSTVVKTGSLAYGRFLGAHRENTGKKNSVHNRSTYTST